MKDCARYNRDWPSKHHKATPFNATELRQNLSFVVFLFLRKANYVFPAVGNFLHYSVHRDRRRTRGAALGAARLVRPERLGQQLFSVARLAKSRLRRAKVYRLGLGARRRLWHRYPQFGHGILGAGQFPKDRPRAGRRAAICGKLAADSDAARADECRSTCQDRSFI